MTDELRNNESAGTFRTWLTWFGVGGTALWTGMFWGFLGLQLFSSDSSPDNWFINVIKNHFAATVGIGISAISAFCLVALLEVTTGRIELEGFGFKFKGAAGPVVLWAMCFLAMIGAVRLLWPLT